MNFWWRLTIGELSSTSQSNTVFLRNISYWLHGTWCILQLATRKTNAKNKTHWVAIWLLPLNVYVSGNSIGCQNMQIYSIAKWAVQVIWRNTSKQFRWLFISWTPASKGPIYLRLEWNKIIELTSIGQLTLHFLAAIAIDCT